ncbi:hypothetical protein [uncultured Erythrobacter sp.]|uniref:hypothetical protein n=1 Tax=uncultured Erythrobacter sp. TaxID=263913 RepID=UPI002638A9EA|nr:hypothetical protein [uncultured Erythrobacter sp.]
MLARIGHWVALIAGVFVAPLAAQEPPTESESAAIALALQRGEALYRHDQAAWHTTDAMLEDVRNPGAKRVRGWIINDVPKGHEAVFYRPIDGGFEAVWSGVYDGKKVRQKTEYPAGARILTAAEATKAVASRLPVNEEMQRCSQKPFNTVVLPTGKSDGSLYVYYLVPQESLDTMPFGGHYRYEVKDGEIVGSRKFTNSCITMGNRGPNDEKPVATTISHSLDPTPTEIHVFAMFALDLSVAVLATQSDKVWMIQNTREGPIIGTLARSNN